MMLAKEIKQKRAERLRYIQSMLGELRQMAEAERLDMLTYLIEMAYVEASDIARGARPRRKSKPKPSDQRDAVA
ncbi:MAG: hypothetical protein AAF940_06890 [Pseudomonadota bacterium]